MRELIYTYSLYLKRKMKEKNKEIVDQKKLSKGMEENQQKITIK